MDAVGAASGIADDSPGGAVDDAQFRQGRTVAVARSWRLAHGRGSRASAVCVDRVGLDHFA